MADKYPNLIFECETNVRLGRLDQALLVLRDLNIKQLPERYRLPIANLCRRTGLTRRGLMTLAPFFDVDRAIPDDEQDPKILAEYAILLMRYGVVREALLRLQEIRSTCSSEIYFARTLCYLNLWDYQSALHSVQEYLKFELDPYSKLVGQMNLIAAKLMDPIRGNNFYPQLDREISEAIQIARVNAFQRLLGNCLELKAQFLIDQKNYPEALKILDEALALLQEVRPREYYYVRKWQAVAQALLENDPQKLLVFRDLAVSEQQWETVRSIDLNLLKIEFDPRRFHYLYVGSPSESFRGWICHLLGKVPPPGEYLYGNVKGPQLDLATGSVNGELRIKPGNHTHSVLRFLFSDFYKPRRLGEIFSFLFPEDVFDSYSSPDRVQKVIGRARIDLRESEIPLEIEELDFSYRMRLKDVFCIQVGSVKEEMNAETAAWTLIRKNFKENEPFQGKAVQDLLKISKASVQRLLLGLLDKKKLKVEGLGKATRYRY